VIHDLASHSAPYVTIGELALYWGVSRRQVRKYIDAGKLEATMLGPRLVRIRTDAALELERVLIASSRKDRFGVH
jgi:excisionase family DNA binding protein